VGRRSVIAERIDRFLAKRGWIESKFDTKIVIDKTDERDTPTHKVDCFKGKVGLEIEWNNKDPFFDRDLNNFRLVFELRVIDAGVIITRASHLQGIVRSLGKKVANKIWLIDDARGQAAAAYRRWRRWRAPDPCLRNHAR
jgi:hypothetical protein